ncbi:jg210 [Pararge aegeria aegeria]|uniref:Jg210 protein n=1 Tax=Pararge aegeria aegeria TaxID=348720 RepID=A0A8S4QWA2_9NEOP|nr:jg210 [Pararge aegeria aegeria]
MLGNSLESCKAEVKMGGLGVPMDVGDPECWNGDPAHVNAALIGPQRGDQTTSNVSLGADGNKRPRTVDF